MHKTISHDASLVEIQSWNVKFPHHAPNKKTWHSNSYFFVFSVSTLQSIILNINNRQFVMFVFQFSYIVSYHKIIIFLSFCWNFLLALMAMMATTHVSCYIFNINGFLIQDRQDCRWGMESHWKIPLSVFMNKSYIMTVNLLCKNQFKNNISSHRAVLKKWKGSCWKSDFVRSFLSKFVMLEYHLLI